MLQVTRVFAQQASLSLSPTLLEVYTKPGRSFTLSYNLENRADPTYIRIKVLDFESDGNLGNIRLKPDLAGPFRFSLENTDLKLDEPYFLKNKESKKILLNIRVTENITERDYYYSLLIETEAPPAQEGATSAQIKTAITSNILITVTSVGNIDLKARIALFDVLPHYKFKLFGRQINIFDSGDKIPVVLIVENKGKNFVKPKGEIVLRNGSNAVSKHFLQAQNILAESQRLLTATPSAALDCSKKSVSKICNSSSLILPGLLFGSYKLGTSLNFGKSSPNLYASASFLVIPIKLIIGLIILTLIALLFKDRIKEK